MKLEKEVLDKLIKSALESRENAYVPYSGFKVGASVLTENDEIIGGFNIENASYGATNCAERTAIFTALNIGHKEIKAIAVVGDLESFTYPCGICRQVLVEFSKGDIPVIVVKNEKEYKIHTLNELLPGAFTGKDLEEAKKEGSVK